MLFSWLTNEELARTYITTWAIWDSDHNKTCVKSSILFLWRGGVIGLGNMSLNSTLLLRKLCIMGDKIFLRMIFQGKICVLFRWMWSIRRGSIELVLAVLLDLLHVLL